MVPPLSSHRPCRSHPDVSLGTRAAVREKVDGFFTDLSHRREEVKRRCRTALKAKADEIIGDAQANPLRPRHVDFTLASVQVTRTY